MFKSNSPDAKFLSDKHYITFNAGQLKPVPADRKHIMQVLTNMMTNAFKYSPEGGEVIIASLETSDGVEISVQDWGIGIPSTEKEKIFDRYFRVSSPASKGYDFCTKQRGLW